MVRQIRKGDIALANLGKVTRRVSVIKRRGSTATIRLPSDPSQVVTSGIDVKFLKRIRR